MRATTRSPLLWLAFLCILLAVCWGLGPKLIAAARSYTWRETPCTVEHASIVEEPFSSTVTHYVLQVKYHYTFEGRGYSSTRFTTGEHQGSQDVSRAQRALLQFAPGKTATCFVNPRDPREAVLQRGELWGAVFLLMPFLIVGIFMHEEIFARLDLKRQGQLAAKDLPLSERNEALRTDGRQVLFGLLAFAVGVFFLVFCLAGPLWNWRKSRQWPATVATITRCELEQRSSIHGPDYSLQLLYEYEFGGQHYQSNQRDFANTIDEGVADISAWIAAHPPGSKLTGWVNPADPTEAVLERKIEVGWISLGLGLVMLAFGSYLFGEVVHTRRLRRTLSGKKLFDYWQGRVLNRPRIVRVSPHPAIMALGCGLGMLVLAALGSWSLSKGIRALLLGHGDVLNLIYGAGAAAGAIAAAVKLFKFIRKTIEPLPVLEIDPGTPAAGQPFRVRWKFSGWGTVHWLRISLEGSEETKVRRVIHGMHGSVSEERTDRAVFLAMQVVSASGREAISGDATVNHPKHSMHSLRAVKAAIVWRLKVEYGREAKETMEYSFPITFVPTQP